jgi:hypothetical protein
MGRFQSITLNRGTLVRRLDLSHTLAAVVKLGLALLIAGSIIFGIAMQVGIAPEFDERIVIAAQHSLVIHNGPSPTCTFIPNPPQHDCFAPSLERREFSVDYLTPHGVRSLVLFRLPTR